MVAAIREIAVQLRGYAPTNCLLWVTAAEGGRTPGSVERQAEGVFRGFLSRYGDYEGRPHLPVEEWVSVCAKAYRLWRSEDPPEARFENLISQGIVEGSCAWSGDPAVATQALQESSPTGGSVIEHRIAKTGATPVCGVTLPIAAGGTYSFSVWVWIPEDFRGSDIYLLLAGFDTVAHWPADPKSHARWQRVWVTATLPGDARLIACWIMADAAEGDVLHSTSWCLERANAPSGHGFAV